MKIGIQELKESFQGFTWFEQKKIRNEASLSQDEIKWLRRWTLSPLGIASLIYLVSPRRKLYDIATASIITSVFFDVYEKFLSPLVLNNSASNLAEKYPYGIFTALSFFFLVGLPFTVASIYIFYFTLRHGRRLSWNRGNWTTVEELKKSESRWFYFNTLPSLIIAALLIGSVYL